jgi:ABC-2 type transport system permease protein
MNLDHFKTVFWLRWRLTRNQLTKGGSIHIFFTILSVAFSIFVAVGALIGGFCFAFFALKRVEPRALLGIWDVIVGVFLFFWTLGFVIEIQRSESLNMEKFLHLPLSLSQVFLLNYVGSFFTMSLSSMLPFFAGFCLGSISHLGPRALLQFGVIMSFVFMITAWTYCVRGWLSALMINPKRRRTVIAIVGFTFFIVSQSPTLIFQTGWFKKQTGNGKSFDWSEAFPAILTGHVVLPMGWPALAAMRLREGHSLPALEFTSAALLLGALGLSRAYRSTLRFYRGETREGGESARVRESLPAKSAKNWMAWRLPGLPDEAGAIALANFQSMMRSPEIKMAIFIPFFFFGIAGPIQFLRRFDPGSRNQLIFALAAIAIIPFIILVQLMGNIFGADRDGFRSYLLSPAKRENILLGKNFSMAPLSFGLSFFCLSMLLTFGKVSALILVPAVLQMASAFLIACVTGNLISILAPYRVNPGSTKASKMTALRGLLQAVTQLSFPLTLVPVVIPAALDYLFRRFSILPWLPVFGIASFIVFAGCVAAYALLLPTIGRLLQAREQKILLIVTRELE